MQIAILATDAQREEISAPPSEIVSWHKPGDTPASAATIIIDLAPAKNSSTFSFPDPAILLVNDPVGRINNGSQNVVRFNGWNSFLKSPVWEASGDEAFREKVAAALQVIGREVLWCPDVPGLISARVVSMIINEAYLALETGVSSKSDIDIAMKTGTNYPYGPFEWAAKIGKSEVVQLLEAMSVSNKKYQPSPLLVEDSRNVTK